MHPEIIESMSCEVTDNVADLANDLSDWRLEPKYDGFRIIAHVVAPGKVELWTRGFKEKSANVPYIADALAHLPVGTVLDGEVIGTVFHVDGTIDNGFELVQSIMNSLPPQAAIVASQKRQLQYMVFDVMRIGDADYRDRPWIERRGILEGYVFEGARYMGANVDIMLSPYFHAAAEKHQEFLDAGFEGSIAKHVNGAYLSGKTSKAVRKLKPQKIIDVIVTGFTDGDGKYTGQIGAVMFGQPAPDFASELGESIRANVPRKLWSEFVLDGKTTTVIPRGQCSGMTDALRLEMTQRKQELVGTTISIKHMGVYPNGISVRHPQFDRFRDDKPANLVTWHDK